MLDSISSTRHIRKSIACTTKLKPKPHSSVNGSTKHLSLRIPDHVMSALESDSARLGISVNSMSNSIFKKWAKWDRHAQKLGLIPVPKDMFSMLLPDNDKSHIHALVSTILPFFKESVILMKGRYDLKRCIETLEDYMHTTGIVSEHTVEGPTHCFIIRHGMGDAWSTFINIIMERLFAEFVPDIKAEYDMDTNIVSVRISLGHDWDEHDY